MRKKLQAELTYQIRRHEELSAAPDERRTRSLGVSRNDSVSADSHKRALFVNFRLPKLHG
jgi:hypothetical protein